ncbi:hypothetical protein [[Clostridium] scindens]|uniref:hypothetical protein n=1 Tax=Clostridium scindens (strain JCM 10418 / VPI 12708) TaxID=29347 RepID=UPI0039F4CC55
MSNVAIFCTYETSGVSSGFIINHTDRYWGAYEEFYREINGKRYLDAVIVSITMPDNEIFDGMRKLAQYLFESSEPLKKSEKTKSQRGRLLLYFVR